jgi:diphthine methyl ester acylhydrolase
LYIQQFYSTVIYFQLPALILEHANSSLSFSSIAQTLASPFAIFDLHFCPGSYSFQNLFGVATSTGSLALYSIIAANNAQEISGNISHQLKHERTLQFITEDSLVTSFSWHPTMNGIFGMTLSSGEVKLCRFDMREDTRLGKIDLQNTSNITTVLSHNLEAWTLAFAQDGHGIYTGGDDSTLRYRSLPDLNRFLKSQSRGKDDESTSDEALATASLDEYIQNEAPGWQWIDKRTHSAGVTAILPLTGNVIATGSYDDHIRLLECPEFGPRRVLLERDLGGGVWRLKQIESQDDSNLSCLTFRIMASCMHAGTRVIDIIRTKDGAWSLEIVFKFEEHRSMNYATDFQSKSEVKRAVVSASFYDKLVCLWQV